MILKAKILSHRILTDHILFRILVDKDGQQVEAFSKSYIKASTPDKTDVVLGMTRKRLALMDVDVDNDQVWDAFCTHENLLAGKEIEVEEKDNPPYGVQYDILTNAVADDVAKSAIRDALRGVKGRPRAAAAPAPARPTPAAPARPAAPRPLAQNPAPAASSKDPLA